MKIGIVGAGAVGSWIAARFARAGHHVSILARGATLDALRATGLHLTDSTGTHQFDVRTAASGRELGAQDIVVVAVKSPALAAVAPHVAELCTDATIVIPAMNGVPWWFETGVPAATHALRDVVDPQRVIETAIARPQVLGCVVHASGTIVAPGHTRLNMADRIVLGEPNGGTSERLTRTCALFTDAGITTTSSEQIQQDIWYKLWGNMTMNPVSAITGATADRIIDDPDVRAVLHAVMREAAETGARIGCTITEDGDSRIDVTRRLGAFRTSMLQDVEARRAIELDALLTAPRAIAAAVHVPTPAMSMLLGLTRLFAQTHGLLGSPPTV
jgi:2-dehydropantoate 2-reductase